MRAASPAPPAGSACRGTRCRTYGDFSLKLQWRDSSAGTNGNSGVFVRFPHPTETVAAAAGGPLPVPGRLGDERPGVGGDLLRPRDPDQRPSGRRPEDRLDLQLLAERRHSGADPAEGDVGRLRGQGRRPAVHDHPQRDGDQAVPELARPAVVAGGRPADQRPPVRARLHRAPEPRHQRRDRLPQRPRAAARRGLGPRAGHRRGRRRAHGRVPLDRRGRQRGGGQEGRVHDRRGRRDGAADHPLRSTRRSRARAAPITGRSASSCRPPIRRRAARSRRRTT